MEINKPKAVINICDVLKQDVPIRLIEIKAKIK